MALEHIVLVCGVVLCAVFLAHFINNLIDEWNYHKHVKPDYGHFILRSIELGEDVTFTSRKQAVKFAKRFHGIVYDCEKELIIANYEKEN